jgi:HlyD family secretion protein
MKTRNIILIALGSVAVMAVLGFVVVPRFLTTGPARAVRLGNAPQIGGATAQVVTLTLVTSIESTGSVEAIQSESLYWKTTGTVADVFVKVGDTVKKGDVLMTIDPATASQSVIQAQTDLISAQEALEALLNPSAIDIASAQKAVADAEEALLEAQQDLKYAQNPVGQSLYDAVDDAKLALDTAQANIDLSRVGSEAEALTTAENNKNQAYSVLQRAQVTVDDCLKISCAERDRYEKQLTSAQNNYQAAVYAYDEAKIRYGLAVATHDNSLDDAQQTYEQAVANLNAALAGPDALTVQTAQATVAVAEATLADAQDALDKLLNGADPDEVAAAQAKVSIAQATVDSLILKAPFDGEVLAVYFRPGDSATQTDVAVILANRSQLYVDVAVDESDISQVSLGDPATLSLDALPALSFTGKVSQVVPLGETVQGLVKYTVRVDFDQTDPKVLLGMTANASIVADTLEGALAVPIDAVQQDDTGEYVSRLKADGTVEKVKVVSGSIQDNDLVVVTGDLQPGDVVRMVSSASSDDSTSNSDTRGPGGPGLFGGGPP